MLEFYYIELGLLFSISQVTDPEVFAKLTRPSVLVSKVANKQRTQSNPAKCNTEDLIDLNETLNY